MKCAATFNMSRPSGHFCRATNWCSSYFTAVWGPAHGQDTQYLRVYIGQLRQKVEDDPDDPKIILTEVGIGYRIAEG